jgi:exopolysaccharide biosynthesis polyprenyl glycosylphosphotransferase
MVPRLSTTVDLAPLLIVSSQIVFPFPELRHLSTVLLIVATATLVRFVAKEIRPKKPRVLILGAGPMASRLIEEIEATRNPRFDVAGIVDDEQPDHDAPDAQRWLGPCDRLAEIVERVSPACIVVAVADRRDRLPLQSLLESRVRGILVEDALDFYERLTGKIAIEACRPSVLIMSRGFRNHGAAETMARIVSMVVSVIGLIVMAPLLAALAIAINLDSHGPVFFIQHRAGRGGKPFGLVKFRTMHPCAEARSEWVTDNLDRITAIGRWLRRFRLDELPQLVNVLRGEMNLIGPRPHPTSNHAVFVNQIAYYGLRNSVRPGVTGWAQVRYGYANNLEEETEKMRYDLYYIKNRSLWLDVRILFETVGIIVFGQGASEVRRPSPSRSALLPAQTRRREAPDVVERSWRGGAQQSGYMPWLANSTSARPSAGQS